MAVGLLFLSAKKLILPSILHNTGILNLLVFVAILVPLRCAGSVFSQFLRAEQKTKSYNLFEILSRYAGLAISLFFVFYFIKGLTGFFFGRVVAQTIIFIFIAYVLFKNQKITFKSLSSPFLKECIKYGFPLIWFEFTVNILAYGDRFLIQHYLGPGDLGIYSAGYNLSMYCSNMLALPLRLAILPIYIQIWTNEGKEKTEEFLSKALNYFLLVATPIIFGFSAIGKDIIILLASDKYSQSYTIIPFIASSLIIYSSYHICAAGLHIYKRTPTLTKIFIIGCVMNIFLNILLIPRLGIIGAAAATSAAYLTLLLLVAFFSLRLLKFKIYYRDVFRFILFSLIMFIIVKNINTYTVIINLLMKIGIGAFIYTALILIFDAQIRKKLGLILRRPTVSYSA